MSSMVHIDEVGAASLQRLEKILGHIPNGTQRAVRSTMNRATSTLRTNSTKEIQKRYDISAGAIRSNENVRVRYVTGAGGGIAGEILFSGSKIPLYRYGGASPKSPAQDMSSTVAALVGGQWKRVHPGVAAMGHQLKSTGPSRFQNAFVARFKSGHMGIFERSGAMTSSGKDEIKEIMGSAVAQMVGNDEVKENLGKLTSEKFEERLEVEISRLINGYGG